MGKKRCKNETLIQDRLSSLPDDVLIHILSFMSTKQSVSTSILSNRWKYLFTYVPSLDFNCFELWNYRSCCTYQNHENFKKFVNEVLRLHKASCIRSFRLLVYHPFSGSESYSWIEAAIRLNVRLLEVVVQNAHNCFLPTRLFTCETLVHLKLTGNIVIGVDDFVCVPSLKTCYLNTCKFGDDSSVRRLFSSCPVLEDLTLYNCHTFYIKVFSICIPSLKRLKIYSPFAGSRWELNVPNLEYIHCTSSTERWCSVNYLKSLHKAEVCLINCIRGAKKDGRLWELVNRFEEVRFLSLSRDSMESLARASVPLPMLNKLTTLELQVSSCGGWSFFPTLLDKVPCLELLVIHEDGFLSYDQKFPEINVLLPKHIPVCFSRSLKEVKLSKFEGHEVEYEWLSYLLANAMVLDKLTITVRLLSLVENEEEEYFAYQERSAISKALLDLPRASKTCQVIVTSENGLYKMY